MAHKMAHKKDLVGIPAELRAESCRSCWSNNLTRTFSYLDRRSFIQSVGGACVMHAIQPTYLAQLSSSAVDPLRLGLVVWIAEGGSIEDAVKGVRALGLHVCQIGFERLTPEVSRSLKNALSKYEVEATAFSEHGPGKRAFDFYEGPKTVGIVPRDTRAARIRNLKLAADVAAECGILAIHTHCGFIPENPNDSLYLETVAAMKQIAGYCKDRGLSFLCETGQETPITLRRMIEDTGAKNLLVNLDLANLIRYGKGNPVEAMDVLGHLVRGVHAKDGLLPTDTKDLGQEVALGKGRVDFPAVIERLRRANYGGPIHIESETDGEDRATNILRSKAFLETLIGEEGKQRK
jgi:L-ribulose-5-phosphate 3-epimerase